MALQKETIADIIIDILTTNFTSRPVEYSTKLKKHLRSDDGFGSGSSKNIFMGLVGYNFASWGYKKPSWPTDWMEMTVEGLAGKLSENAKPA